MPLPGIMAGTPAMGTIPLTYPSAFLASQAYNPMMSERSSAESSSDDLHRYNQDRLRQLQVMQHQHQHLYRGQSMQQQQRPAHYNQSFNCHQRSRPKCNRSKHRGDNQVRNLL